MSHLYTILELMQFNRKQSEQFIVLLHQTGCTENQALPEFNTPQDALAWLKATTQQNWLRKPGSERWDQNDTDEMRTQRQTFMELFDALGIITEKRPQHQRYDHVLLMGALETRVRTRLAYFLKQENVLADNFVVLGGKRPLMKDKETTAQSLGDNGTEFDMMKAIVEEHAASDPQAPFATTSKVWVDTPMQLKLDGTERRPNTVDTVKHWQHQYQPKPGSILVVSNQPYIDYQHAMVANSLTNPDQFTVETCGHKASDEERISTILDSLARWIYGDFNRIEQQLEKQVDQTAAASYQTDAAMGTKTTPTDVTVPDQSDISDKMSMGSESTSIDSNIL